MEPIRVLLVDDHALLRAGIRALLQALDGFEVVGEASDGREALALVKAREPDVVLMDIAMPGMNGLEATSQIAKEFPDVQVVILSMHVSEEYVSRALRMGAAGYLLKDSGTAELELALRAVARGETYLTPAVSKQVVADYVVRISGESGPLELLTPRQREVLQLIAEGRSAKEIARLLRVTVKTVESHRLKLMERLDIRDVAGLVRYALRVGVIKEE